MKERNGEAEIEWQTERERERDVSNSTGLQENYIRYQVFGLMGFEPALLRLWEETCYHLTNGVGKRFALARPIELADTERERRIERETFIFFLSDVYCNANYSLLFYIRTTLL